jgi:gamma-glutamyltranspeptidase/glutathione hydrolase
MRNFQAPGRSAACGMEAMAATSSPLATLAAIDVLRNGGNAVDAAVTASAVLCVTEPHMTGIGGDCFALVAEPDGTVTGINGAGRAALAADESWLKRSGLASIERTSVHAVTVPGAVDAWDRLLRRFGTISLADALKPAMRLAETGTPVTPRVAFDWPDSVAMLAADPGGRLHYLKGGNAPLTGEVMRYPALARTLGIIAQEGRDAFYEGEIAAEIVDVLGARGGLLRPEDFSRTEASWVEPVTTSFAGRDILEIPPPGVGLTALVALNILSRFDLGRHAPGSPERYHLEIEAMKQAFVLRNRHIGDPEFYDIPVAELLSAGTADDLAAAIDPRRASPIAMTGPASDTVYLSIVDRDRRAVSFINSIYHEFGSGIVTQRSGIALQSRGSGFVTTPGHPNCIGPGKRPLHTIIPAMARRDGRVELSFGVMGGSYQPMGQVQFLVNRYLFGMDVQEAIDCPRLMPLNGEVTVETGIAAATLGRLERMGHRLRLAAHPLGGAQAIEAGGAAGLLSGGSDPRKDGFALGL